MNKYKGIVHSPILYKVLVDILALSLLFTAGFFAIDLVIPGILSAYMPVGALFGFIAFLLIFISVVGKAQKQDAMPKKPPLALLILFILFALPLLYLATDNFPRSVQSILVLGILIGGLALAHKLSQKSA